jgi:hypothetical protein
MTFHRNSSNPLQKTGIFLVMGWMCSALSLAGPAQDASIRPGLRQADLKEAFPIGKSWLLSKVAADIEYIRLETPPGAVVRNAGQVDVGLRYITVADAKNKEAFLFTRDGRFVKRLGREGEGFGEFGSLNNLSLTTGEKYAALFDSGRATVILFSTGEEGIREIPVSDGANLVIGGPGNNLLASYTYPVTSHHNFNQFAWIDTGTGKSRYFFVIPEKVRTWESIGIPVYRVGPQWFVNQLYDNTIYSIDASGTLRPVWYFDLGVQGIQPGSYAKVESFARVANNLYRAGTWTTCNGLLMINLLRGNQVRHVIYDTGDSTAFSLINFGPSRNQVIDNDIDGGPAFWFDLTTGTGEPAQVLPAARILQMRKAGDLGKFTPENPEAAKRFLKLIGQIGESDNPVIQILKK